MVKVRIAVIHHLRPSIVLGVFCFYQKFMNRGLVVIHMISELKQLSDVQWEIPQSNDMHVPTRVFATHHMLDQMKRDRTLLQGKHIAMLPGIHRYAMVLPDGHEGYGFPIGGVAALDVNDGGISPGGIGYDINCLIKDTKVLTSHGF
jgi:tRNA-splicing ligase RtcB